MLDASNLTGKRCASWSHYQRLPPTLQLFHNSIITRLSRSQLSGLLASLLRGFCNDSNKSEGKQETSQGVATGGLGSPSKVVFLERGTCLLKQREEAVLDKLFISRISVNVGVK